MFLRNWVLDSKQFFFLHFSLESLHLILHFKVHGTAQRMQLKGCYMAFNPTNVQTEVKRNT